MGQEWTEDDRRILEETLANVVAEMRRLQRRWDRMEPVSWRSLTTTEAMVDRLLRQLTECKRALECE